MIPDPHIPRFLREHLLKTDSTTEDLLVACRLDIGLGCKTFFPNIFRVAYTDVHRKIIDFINGIRHWQWKQLAAGKPAGVRAAIIGGRGTAKSRFLLHGVPGIDIAYSFFGETSFFVPITKTLPNTLLQSEALRHDLLKNELLSSLCGAITDLSAASANEVRRFRHLFGRNAWVAHADSENPVFCFPRGRHQPVRGITSPYTHKRPDLIVLDDIEEVDELENLEVRDRTRRWLVTDVEECRSRLEAENLPWTIWASDSCKGPDSTIEFIARRPGWEVLRVSICDDDFKTIDPRHISQETLDLEVSRARGGGTLGLWVQEHMARPAVREDAWFKSGQFKPYTEPAPDGLTMVLADISNTSAYSSDPAAFITVTVDLDRNAWYIRDVLVNRLPVADQAAWAVQKAVEYHAAVLAVEVQGARDWAEQLFRDGLASAGLHDCMFLPVLSTQNKKLRILPFVPYATSGRVFVNLASPGMNRLISALCELPSCSDWHPVDALANGLFALSKLGFTFNEARAQAADSPIPHRRKLERDRTRELVDTALEPLDEWFVEAQRY